MGPDSSVATDIGSGNPNPADNGLYTLRSSDGGDLERVTATPEGYDDTNAVDSPDGSRILFSRLQRHRPRRSHRCEPGRHRSAPTEPSGIVAPRYRLPRGLVPRWFTGHVRSSVEVEWTR